MNTVIVMAGGTGGHIYPALTVAHALQKLDIQVVWMGVRGGLESRIAKNAGFEFEAISIRSVWRSGVVRLLTIPFWLVVSLLQCARIILKRRPDLLIGMGGFVCGPGGFASWLLRRPLLIHESNTVPGLTNQLLAPLSNRTLTGFAETSIRGSSIFVGTPVRKEILDAAGSRTKNSPAEIGNLHLLVIGGSQGAKQLNEVVPQAIGELSENQRPLILHQTGKNCFSDVAANYQKFGIEADVREYIEDMAQAYLWADLVISRAGAMTLAEIAVIGLPPILVPYPYAARDHQRLNAEHLSKNECAVVLAQHEFSVERLKQELLKFMNDGSLLEKFSRRIRELSKPNATDDFVQHCMEIMHA